MTTSIAWVAFITLLVAGTIRFCAVAPKDDLPRAARQDELVDRSLDLVMRSVRAAR